MNVHEFAAQVAPGETCIVVLPTERVTVAEFAQTVTRNGLRLIQFNYASGRLRDVHGKMRLVRRMLIATIPQESLEQFRRLALLCGVTMAVVTAQGAHL